MAANALGGVSVAAGVSARWADQATISGRSEPLSCRNIAQVDFASPNSRSLRAVQPQVSSSRRIAEKLGLEVEAERTRSSTFSPGTLTLGRIRESLDSAFEKRAEQDRHSDRHGLMPGFSSEGPSHSGLNREPSGSWPRDDTEKLWSAIRAEALRDSAAEPALASYLYSTILAHRSLERALAFHLGNKLASSTMLSTQLFTLIADTLTEDEGIRQAIRADIAAVKARDPACVGYLHCILNFKGFLACQTHRVAHRLWHQGRRFLALTLQSRVSEVFQVDIHPAARIGTGVLFDHATGLVIGETVVIGNNVSILHHVTLGGTGAWSGKRHPTVEDGVLIGAGAKIVGPITVGEGAKVGAGSVVLLDVPARTTAVGIPARLLGGKANPAHLKEAAGEGMDHTSFIDDYVI